jgi:DNA-binding response OmpR family regulator
MPKILIVEDEPSIAGIAAHKLRREGHEVRCEERADASGVAAWAPALVILDLDCDGGRGMLEELAPRWPVLALTGFGDEEAPALATGAGAAATLGKPFKPTVLARVVNRMTAPVEAQADG